MSTDMFFEKIPADPFPRSQTFRGPRRGGRRGRRDAWFSSQGRLLSTTSMQQSGAFIDAMNGHGPYTMAYAPSHGRPSILRPDAQIFQPPEGDAGQTSPEVALRNDHPEDIGEADNSFHYLSAASENDCAEALAGSLAIAGQEVDRNARRSTVGPSDSVSQVMFSGLKPSEYTLIHEPESNDRVRSSAQMRGGAEDGDATPELVDDTSDEDPASVSSASAEQVHEPESETASAAVPTPLDIAIMEQVAQREAAVDFLFASAKKRAANATRMLDIFAAMMEDATRDLSADQQAFQQTLDWIRGQISDQESQEYHAMTPISFDIYEEMPELIASLAGIEHARKQRNLAVQRIHHKRFAAAENAQRLNEDRISDINERIRSFWNRKSTVSVGYISSVAAPSQIESRDQGSRPESRSDPSQLSSQDIVKTLSGVQPNGGKKNPWYDMCRERFWVHMHDGKAGEVAGAF